MSIKLTKTIDGKKVVLDLISLGGRAVVRSSSLAEAIKIGLTEKDIEGAGFGLESKELVKIEEARLAG